MGELRIVFEIFLLALASAVWPTLIAIVLVALASPRPVRLLSFFLAGGLLTTTALGLAIVFSLQSSSLLSGSRPPTPPAVDLVVGLLLLLVASVAGRTGRREAEPDPEPKPEGSEHHRPWTERLLASGSGRLAFVVGVVLNLVPGLFAVVGYKDIAQLDLRPIAAAALVLAFNLIMFALVELPLIGYFAAPTWTEEHVRNLNGWLRVHGRQVIALVAVIGGAYLVARGAAGLLG